MCEVSFLWPPPSTSEVICSCSSICVSNGVSGWLLGCAGAGGVLAVLCLTVEETELCFLHFCWFWPLFQVFVFEAELESLCRSVWMFKGFVFFCLLSIKFLLQLPVRSWVFVLFLASWTQILGLFYSLCFSLSSSSRFLFCTSCYIFVLLFLESLHPHHFIRSPTFTPHVTTLRSTGRLV